jgi:hypothetical protein
MCLHAARFDEYELVFRKRRDHIFFADATYSPSAMRSRISISRLDSSANAGCSVVSTTFGAERKCIICAAILKINILNYLPFYLDKFEVSKDPHRFEAHTLL